MKPLVALTTSVLVMALAGSSAALTTDNQVLTSKATLNQATPNIVGTVSGTTDYSLSVQTLNHESMTFIVDSRTVVPASLQTGTYVRIEFHAMENGSYHARRITPLRTDEIKAIEQQGMTSQTYYEENREGMTASQETYAEEPAAAHHESHATSSTYQETQAENVQAGDANTDTDANKAMSTAKSEDRLPATASSLPLVGGLGAVALVAATGLWLVRRRFNH